MTDAAKALRTPMPPFALAPGWSFFQCIGLVAIAAAFIGFGGTFFIPMASGRFHAPPIVHLHGLLAFAWLFLFLFQATAIRNRRYRLHRKLGMFGAGLAVALAVTGVAVGVYATRRNLLAGGGATALSGLVGVCTSMTMFLALVAVGVSLRRHAAAHKRLMLLATILVLWPAWFRFRHYFPAVPRPDLVFGVLVADSLIFISMLWDRITFGRVHPVLLWTGLAIFVENLLEVFLFDTPAWRAVALWLYATLSSG
jgi:uncharacterized membrane protein YozB (DUF420 family)